MIKTVGQPHGTAVDRFIAEFSKQDDISCLYVTHDVQFGFVTHKKERNNDQIVERV